MGKLKPLFQPWDETAFSADHHVQRLTYLQKWMYRTLCQQAWVCETRPCLPDDDDELWLLAGCESKEQWIENMGPVRAMFQARKKSERALLARKKLDNDWTKVGGIYRTRRANGRMGGRPKKTNNLLETKNNQEVLQNNQDRTRTKPIEVNVFEVEVNGSKEVKTRATPARDSRPQKPRAPSQPNEQEQRRKIEARDTRLGKEAEVRAEVNVGAGPEIRQGEVLGPAQFFAAVRDLAAKKAL
jgi:hypothetical protein